MKIADIIMRLGHYNLFFFTFPEIKLKKKYKQAII